MSILLRHADIPKYGHRIVILSDGHAYYEDFANPYVDLGEVVKVPPHGRLIDADALPLEESVPTVMMHDGERWISAYELAMAPTVIPAEPQEEEVEA